VVLTFSFVTIYLLTVTQQLTANNKKSRFGPKIGTQDWWLNKIKQEAGHKYTVLWSHFPEYQLRRFKALAEVDYKVLGTELTGAPDHPYRLEQGQVVHYPLKVFVKPHWFPHLHTIDWTDFKLWTWIGGAKAIGGPISEDSETWYNYLSLYQTRLEAREVLGYFKAENSKKLTPDIELELYSILPGSRTIGSITFEVPRGRVYKYLNTQLADHRPLPTTTAGIPFRRRYIRDYLEHRLREYLALGGTQELVEREELGLEDITILPDPFYWDLWYDIDNLREEYHHYCAEYQLDPNEGDEEEDDDSVISWDTQ